MRIIVVKKMMRGNCLGGRIHYIRGHVVKLRNEFQPKITLKIFTVKNTQIRFNKE